MSIMKLVIRVKVMVMLSKGNENESQTLSNSDESNQINGESVVGISVVEVHGQDPAVVLLSDDFTDSLAALHLLLVAVVRRLHIHNCCLVSVSLVPFLSIVRSCLFPSHNVRTSFIVGYGSVHSHT